MITRYNKSFGNKTCGTKTIEIEQHESVNTLPSVHS